MADRVPSHPDQGAAGRLEERVAVRPSTIRLPEQRPPGVHTILDFFVRRFPDIPAATWAERFGAGKVWAEGGVIDAGVPYRPLVDVYYRREVRDEPPVRTDYRVVWSDRRLLVVDKPPDLAVTPGGRWVRGCLLHLLLEATGNDLIAPLHRLDRLTSGLVLLSLDPASRSHYGRLFYPRPLLDKVYTAVCELRRDPPVPTFTLAHHISRSREQHWRQAVRPGLPPNARLEGEVLATEAGLALLRVRPLTGRRHQIRVQLAAVGLPVLGDPVYGGTDSGDASTASERMWLDAHQLTVRDFPEPDGGGTLTATWNSSRPPASFFRRALAAQRHAHWARCHAP